MTDLVVDHSEEVLQLIEKVGQVFRKSLPDFIRIGELLTEQKKALKHGEFGPWLEKLGIEPRSARRYMWVYSQKDNPRLADASNLAEAKKLLSPPRPKTDKMSVLTPDPQVIDTAGEEVPGGSPDVVSTPETPENGPSEGLKRHDATPDLSIPVHQPMVVMGPDPVPPPKRESDEDFERWMEHKDPDEDEDEEEEEDDTLSGSDDIFREDLDGLSAYEETSGDPLADIRAGLGVSPVNEYEIPKATKLAANALADLAEKGPAPARESDEDFERYMAHDEAVEQAIREELNPSEPEPDPLPADWIIILTGVRATSIPEVKVTEALQKLLEKVRAKYPEEP